MAERRRGMGGIGRQMSGYKASLMPSLEQELSLQKTPTPSTCKGGCAQSWALCLLQQQMCASKVPTQKTPKETGNWVLHFIMCRKILWKARVMSAAQCQEECSGKKENTACCTFLSRCDLDTFYYFKHLCYLKPLIITQFSRGILTAFAYQSWVDREAII